MRFHGIADLTAAVRARKISCQEIVYRTLIAVEDNGPLNALTYVDREGAIDRARKLDYRLLKGEDVGALCGVPVVIKDNLHVEGLPTTCSSAMMMDHVASFTATAVTRMLDAGAIVVAKANMDEFAMGSTSTTGITGPVRHPVDVTLSSGGSSGGSAVAVATGQCFAALGTDTGGSIRQPSSLCGIVGLRPTYGAISRYGLVAHAPSLDTVGPMTRSVADNAAVYGVISGADQLDPATNNTVVSPIDLSHPSVKGLKVGYVPAIFDRIADPAVASAMQDALATLSRLGATLVRLDLDTLRYAAATYCVLGCTEAAQNLSRFDGVQLGTQVFCQGAPDDATVTRSACLGYEVKRRILLGSYFSDEGKAYYDNALRARAMITQDFDRALTQCDLIVAPSSPTTAFPIEGKRNAMHAHLADEYLIPPALAGLPAISVPYATDAQGLAIGLQLIGRRFSEPLIYRAAAAVEQACKK